MLYEGLINVRKDATNIEREMTLITENRYGLFHSGMVSVYFLLENTLGIEKYDAFVNGYKRL